MLALLVGCSIAPLAHAQNFFGGGVTSYDPEISTAWSGALTDVQVAVSADRKYVTLNMRADNTRLIALVDFPVVNVGGGFVGGVGGGNGGGGGGGGNTGGGGGGLGGGGGGRGGGAGGGGARAAHSTNQPKPSAEAPPSPAEIERRAVAARSILNQQGMFQLARF